jgi:preprotein translocase subunit SecA
MPGDDYGGFERFLRVGEGRRLKRLRNQAEYIGTLEPELEKLSDDELKGKTAEFRERVANGEALEDILFEAYATVREAFKRTMGVRLFDVQMMGGIVLHEGDIAEMKTGEGKTFVATMPLYLNSLPGEWKGDEWVGQNVHLVTVNDYLAKRDPEWVKPVYDALGVRAGFVQNMMPFAERTDAYSADVTYGTNSEFGFDYLRDNMAVTLEGTVQRGHAFAIVDEVDSILIDEARTPLIISGEPETAAQVYYDFARVVKTLTGERSKQDGEVKIVDEFTGRIMEGRRWSEGLHQAVEAKEGVAIQEENVTLATITLQNYFRLYEKLAGMTGTAKTEEKEFVEIYNLNVVEIPTNVAVARDDQNDFIFKTKEAKYDAVLADIKDRHEIGQPVLVGTISVEVSEHLSQLLQRVGIPHNVLNAKAHEREAEIIKDAGQPGAVTIATNMAGRGVDIKLADGMTELGGLYVLGTERHEARRIDNQLRGRSGRQGDPGESRFYLSGHDDLVRLFAGDRIHSIMERFKVPDDQPMESGLLSKQIENAQKKVEEQNFVARKNVLKYDDVMNTQREVIYAQRRQVLDGADLSDEIKSWIDDVIEQLVALHTEGEYAEDWDLDGLVQAFNALTDADVTVDELREDMDDISREALVEDFREEASELYQEKEESWGEEIAREIERYIVLEVVDTRWREHLENMDYLREGVHLRAFAQKDPLVEYRSEGHSMFEELGLLIREEVLMLLFHAQIEPREAEELVRSDEVDGGGFAYQHESLAGADAIAAAGLGGDGVAVSTGLGGGGAVATQQRVTADRDKIGRNDPCWCGSGKKFKKCHGA